MPASASITSKKIWRDEPGEESSEIHGSQRTHRRDPCCGGAAPGGSTTASGGTGGTGISAGTITAFGSVVVNDVHFDETGATVVINDAPGSGDRQGLKIGMAVKIKASFDDDGVTATASDIEAKHEVEGFIESIDAPTASFSVLGQTVYTDTLLHLIVAGSIVPNTKVEVYGLRDSDGAIHATLIEVVDPDDSEQEVRGTVSNLNPATMTFEMGGLTVNYVGAAFEHGDVNSLIEGATVEVKVDASNPGVATAIEFEDIEDSEFEAGEGEMQELEGYIANYNGSAGTFTVVQVTSTTVLRPSNAVLSNDIPVTARGTTSNGVLIANEIELH